MTIPGNQKGDAIQFPALVFLTAFACLMFELIVSRVADFHLDFRNSFLALPIAFLGLAAGSLHVHFDRRIVDRFRIDRALLVLAAACAVMLTAVFLIFGRMLPVIGSPASADIFRQAFVKIAVFIAVCAIPFYIFGRILTIGYYVNRERIGAIYSADFFGAALGCLITPLCFHFLELPGAILVFMGAMGLAAIAFRRDRLAVKAISAVILIPALAGLDAGIRHLDNTNDFTAFLSGGPDESGVELAHGWNEFSRCSLARISRKFGGTPRYVILHDNAVSNVHVEPFRENYFPAPAHITAYELPFLALPKVDDALVMFAGCGAEMVNLYAYSGGKADITGVEINGLCRDLVCRAPELKAFALEKFYGLPNVHLRIAEGRGFLQENPKQYDLIFIGSKAATTVRLSGHTRKYLDTEEAYELYLRRLNKGGMLVFHHQPLAQTFATLHHVFEKMKLPPLAQCAILFTYGGKSRDLAVCPDGFKEDVIKALAAHDGTPSRIVYAPYAKLNKRDAQVRALISTPGPDTDRTTDDRPYESKIAFAGYTLMPTAEQQNDGIYYLNWSKITTMWFITLLSLAMLAATYLRPSSRAPLPALAYLLLTGFCYLVVEVIFMAKLELFLRDPLIGMAAVLTVFLLCSGIGSALFNRMATRFPFRTFPFVVAGLVLLSAPGLTYLNVHALGAPLAARLLLASALMAPVAICLGMFYPAVVTALVRNGRESAVPVTYGISTLSSVIGATFAMTMVINLGGNRLLEIAATLYTVLGILLLVYSLLARPSMFAFK